MKGFSIKLFQFFGIFPFSISPNNEIKIQYFWTILSATVIIPCSIWRAQIYTYHILNFSDGHFYNILVKIQPFLSLIEMLLLYYLVLRRKSVQQIRDITKGLLELSSMNYRKSYNVKIWIYAFIHMLLFVYLVVFVFSTTNSAVLWLKFDGIICMVQDLVRSLLLLKLCMFSNIIILSLTSIEAVLVKTNKSSFRRLIKIVSTQTNVGKNYHSVLSLIILQCLFNSLFSLNFLRSMILSVDKKHFVYGIIFCCYQTPLLFLVIHSGEICEKKVLKT